MGTNYTGSRASDGTWTNMEPAPPAPVPNTGIPVNSWEPIYHTQAATTDVPYAECRSVWVGRGGDVMFTMGSGVSGSFHNVDDGTLLPIRVTAWTDISTSGATNILFLY